MLDQPASPFARHALLTLLVPTLVAGYAGSAHAFDPGLHWAVGAKGGMNLSLLSEPAKDVVDLPVPGFVGISGGGGFAGEMLFGDFVGLEIDVLYAKTSGKGNITVNTAKFDETLETTELQIPVLLKGQIPFGLVKPFLTLGLTFVNQMDAKYEIVPPANIATSIDTTAQDGDLTESYKMLTLGLGATVDLPMVRIPIELRALYQSLDDAPADRAEWTVDPNLTQLAVTPKWEGQIWLLIGVQYSDGMIF